MGETLTEQRRVSEEGLRVVKLCCKGRTSDAGNGVRVTVLYQKATANYVPAAAVYVGGERYPESLGVKREQAAARVCGERPKLNFGKPWKPGG